ncbi:uncharacterized protein [Gossypium hirsutum]|uniref:Reverse transcriptase n=1 Tax=Gossypium hirsutum TaxID=3635 RepID=A0A1U8HMW7_GOSHI|nr:uncharacterized protein LOC107887644 [Gossypium hirsutum]
MNGSKMKADRCLRSFQNFIEGRSLIDLPAKGQFYTWFNSIEGQVIRERLDRVLVNKDWLDIFSDSLVFNLFVVGSDHSPIVLTTGRKDRQAPRRFKFELMWAELDECEEIIKEGWDQFFMEPHAFICCRNLKEEYELKVELKRVWSLEEKYWFQYSRVKWLEFGDKNTKFFHQTTMYLRQFNKVLRIKDESSVWLDEELDIIKKFRGFTILVKGVPEEEIRAAVFQLGAYKAPRLDGFNGFSFQKFWEVVKEDVIKAVVVAREIFHYFKLKKKGKKGEMTLKVDMNKAYDKVEWDFLEEVILRLGFDVRWVGWVMECVNDKPSVWKASGQSVNRAKSNIVFSSNMDMRIRAEIVAVLGIPKARCPD